MINQNQYIKQLLNQMLKFHRTKKVLVFFIYLRRITALDNSNTITTLKETAFFLRGQGLRLNVVFYLKL